MYLNLMQDPSSPDHERWARKVKRFKAKYGEDWDGTMIEYSDDLISLPMYVVKAVGEGNFRTVLQWLGKGNIKERVNAKLEDLGNTGLLWAAATTNHHDLMSYLLLNDADVNILDSEGVSVLTQLLNDEAVTSKTLRLILSWGAEIFFEGKQLTKEEKLDSCGPLNRSITAAAAKLMASDLCGRRCEIVSAPSTRVDLVGKTCVVEEYLEGSDQYNVKMEFTSEVLLLGVDYLKRRDRTPQDPGYYVECKNNRLICRDFKSNEECQAFTASLDADEDEVGEVDPDAEDRAEQAAADLLAELGLEDLEGPSVEESNKKKQSSGKKKKKRVVKKKGRK